MAKKSQRRAIRYEKDKSGCMWGFISMFDFRLRHSTRKLIADKRRSCKHVVGNVHSKNKFEVLNNIDEDTQGTFESGESKRPTVRTSANKPSVKKLIEEEMFTKQNATKGITNNTEIESKESRQRREVLLKLDSKRKKKLCEKKCDITDDSKLDATMKSETSHHQHSRKKSIDNFNLDKIIEEFCHKKGVYSMMHGDDGEVEMQTQPNHDNAISEKNARDTIREFVNQMIMNGKDLEEAKKLLCSDELMEALQLISSDKELFLAFLQNPNSLVMKCVQESGNSKGENVKDYIRVTSSNFSEQDHGDLEQTRETVNHKKHNFFRKKVKFQSKCSENENGNTEFPNKIVILKPGPMGLKISEAENNLASCLDSHDTVRYNGPSERGSSHFSLTEIKKKLKHAMGRERRGNSEGVSRNYPAECQNKRPGNKAIGKDNVGMRSPNKDHFFIEKIARPTTGVMKSGKNKVSELIVEHEKSIFPRQGVSNLYTKAKKHLREMVGNGDENIDLTSRHISKSLGRILSLPDYNFSPYGSPGRDWEHHFVTAKTRFSSSDEIWEVNKDYLSPKQATFFGDLDQDRDNPEKQSSICDESSSKKVEEIKSDTNFSDDQIHVDKEENYCPARDEIVTEGNVKSAKEITILESYSKPVGLNAGKEDQDYDISEIPDSARCSQCLEQNVTEEKLSSSPLSSPSCSSITKITKAPESVTNGRPSPVSVLDPSFLEDNVSPGHSRCQPAEIPIQPLHIQFEEQDISPLNQIKRAKYCFEESELIYNYIEAILQASGFNRDQLSMKCLSSDNILDPSLFNQVEFLSNQLCHDQKLLYDCVNEVLMEVCHDYFGTSPFVSFVHPGIRPTPNLKRVILMVSEGVCWHFLPLPPPQSLEKIVRKDVEKSEAWMDLRTEAETVGSEMSNAILAELMEDTILSYVSKSSENETSQLQSEDKNNKNSTNV